MLFEAGMALFQVGIEGMGPGNLAQTLAHRGTWAGINPINKPKGLAHRRTLGSPISEVFSAQIRKFT